MDFSLSFIREETGGFDNDIDAGTAPGNSGRISFREYADAFAIDQKLAFTSFDGGVQRAGKGIIFKKMGESFTVSEIIDRHHLKVIATESSAQDVSSDSAESVNTNFDHDALLS
jgi:hypothetical protein